MNIHAWTPARALFLYFSLYFVTPFLEHRFDRPRFAGAHGGDISAPAFHKSDTRNDQVLADMADDRLW